MKNPLFASIMNIFLCYDFDVDDLKDMTLTTRRPPTSMKVNTLQALPLSLEIIQLPLGDANHLCV